MVAAVLRVQLRKLPKITGEMRRFKNSLKAILSKYDDVRTRTVADPGGDSGAFLKMTFKDEQTAWAFKDGLIRSGIRVRDNGLYPIHMTEWGFHIYYNNGSLVNKSSICGHHSVWDLKENEFARNVSYAKGTLKHLDDIVERTVIFCIASKRITRMFALDATGGNIFPYIWCAFAAYGNASIPACPPLSCFFARH